MASQKAEFAEIISIQRKQQNLAHAYLVFGFVDLDIILQTLNLKKPDFFKIAENPIKIDHIRALIRWAYIKPHSSEFKLAVLEQVENMTLEAANALLKVLEEAPASTILILQANKKENILPTVLSRCAVFRGGKNLPKDLPSDFLSAEKIAKLSIKEKFDYVSLIYTQQNLLEFLNLWEEEFRTKLLLDTDSRPVLLAISKSRRLLSTNTSVKLLLENLLLKF